MNKVTVSLQKSHERRMIYLSFDRQLFISKFGDAKTLKGKLKGDRLYLQAGNGNKVETRYSRSLTCHVRFTYHGKEFEPMDKELKYSWLRRKYYIKMG